MPDRYFRAARNWEPDYAMKDRVVYLRRIYDKTKQYGHLAQVDFGVLNGNPQALLATRFGFQELSESTVIS